MASESATPASKQSAKTVQPSVEIAIQIGNLDLIDLDKQLVITGSDNGERTSNTSFKTKNSKC